MMSHTESCTVQVEEIALLNTTLIKWDGSRVLYPNYKMNTDMITNITRSNNKGEVFSVNVDFSTSLEVFAQIEALIKIHSDASPDINAIAVSPGNAGNPLKFTMNIWWEYTFNSKSPCCVLLVIAQALCHMLYLCTCMVWLVWLLLIMLNCKLIDMQHNLPLCLGHQVPGSYNSSHASW